jgi:hypothetical protein
VSFPGAASPLTSQAYSQRCDIDLVIAALSWSLTILTRVQWVSHLSPVFMPTWLSEIYKSGYSLAVLPTNYAFFIRVQND